MPIYEFFSPDTNRIYSFFARSPSLAAAVPRCPDDPKARMERLVSRFAVTGKAREKSDGASEVPDPAMERMMAEMEREMATMDDQNPDPRQLGRLMRKMTEATGKQMPDQVEQMLRRLESGEDPESLEEEFGDALDGMGDDLFGGEDPDSGEASRLRRVLRRGRPARDPKLYEFRDYLD